MTGLQIKATENKGNGEGIIDILLAVFFMTAISRIICTAFSSVADIWWIYGIEGCALCILLFALYKSKINKYVMQTGVIVATVCIGISFLLFRDGFFELANDYLDFLTGKTGRIHLDYAVQNSSFAYIAAGAVFMALAVLLAEAIKMRRKISLFVMLAVIFTGQCVGFFTTGLSIILLIIAAVLFLVPIRNAENTKGYFVRHAVSRVVTVLIALGITACFGYMLYAEEVSLLTTADSLKQNVHSMRYDSGSVSMPEGKLADLGAWKRDSDVSLEIEMETSQKMYLRGMTGEVYTGLSWEQASEKTYLQGEDTFYWLHKSDYYSQNSIAQAMKLSGQDNEQTMVIRNINACGKNNYLPYGLMNGGNLDPQMIGDSSVKATDDEISITYIPGSLPEWYMTELVLVDKQNKTEIGDYLEKERTYSKYVHENYLQMTNASVGVCSRVLGETPEKMTLSSITKLIMDKLESNMEYSEHITTRSGKNDFLQYSLEHQKKGYSVHYATAAVMLLRYCGVPARYVEGYFISADEAAGYASGETIKLTEDHAHAWAEYYLDGVGWIPFEVTPGYIDEEELLTAQKIASDSEGLGNSGHSFSKNELKYKPPINSPKENEAEGEASTFRLSVMDVVKILIALIIIIIAIIVIRIVKRYLKLKRTLESLAKVDNRTAIAMEYGYAVMLAEKAGIKEKIDNDEMYLLNREALFSNHIMTPEQRQQMEDYRKNVLNECKKQWGRMKRFCNHYVLWLYK